MLSDRFNYKSNYKHIVLFSLLALTLCAAVWVSGESENKVDTVEKTPTKVIAEKTHEDKHQRGNQANDQRGLPLNKLQRHAISVTALAEGNNPFSAKSWYSPPPPIPTASLPPAAPTAPPLPFVYAGKLQEDVGNSVFYLTHDEQFFAVKQGETFDNIYRLEGVENGKLIILYLPLKIKQFLPITPDTLEF